MKNLVSLYIAHYSKIKKSQWKNIVGLATSRERNWITITPHDTYKMFYTNRVLHNVVMGHMFRVVGFEPKLQSR